MVKIGRKINIRAYPTKSVQVVLCILLHKKPCRLENFWEINKRPVPNKDVRMLEQNQKINKRACTLIRNTIVDTYILFTTQRGQTYEGSWERSAQKVSHSPRSGWQQPSRVVGAFDVASDQTGGEADQDFPAVWEEGKETCGKANRYGFIRNGVNGARWLSG